MPDSPATNRDLKSLEGKLDNHIEEYKMHKQEYLERQAHQDTMQENNMKAIAELVAATKGVVDAWAVANGFQKFIKWLSGFGLVGALIAWGFSMAKDANLGG